MEKTIKPAKRAHSFVIFMAIFWVALGIVQGGGGGFIMAILGGAFFGLILIFSVKGNQYIFKNGIIKKRHWTGREQTLKISDIQKTKIKNRAFGTGDLILWTPSGKFKIEKISAPNSLQDEITGTI